MRINKPLFSCARCHINTLSGSTLEKLFGEWIVRCPECGAKNLVKTIAINNVVLLTAIIIGWRD